MTDKYYLSKGAHSSPYEGRCAMEWVAYLAHEPHSDSPQCVCPVLKSFCVSFNDGLSEEERQKLRPYLARCIGTADDGMGEERSWMAMDWLIRVYTPTWLSLAGLEPAANRLRALPPVLAAESLARAMDDLGAARRDAVAAWAAARDVAGVAARAAARTAARDVAWVAARDVARAAAGDVARAAAGDVAGDVARAAAWAAAGDVAGDVARDVAWAAARDALVPTVIALQVSTFELLDKMLPTVPLVLPVAEDADLVCGVA